MKLTLFDGVIERISGFDLDEAHGSFQAYLRAHGSFDETLKAIRKDFKFMGPTGIYVFLYVVGEEVIPYEEFKEQY